MDNLTPLQPRRREQYHNIGPENNGEAGYSSLHSRVHSRRTLGNGEGWRSGNSTFSTEINGNSSRLYDSEGYTNLYNRQRTTPLPLETNTRGGTQLPPTTFRRQQDDIFDVAPNRSINYPVMHPRGPTRLQTTPPYGVPVTTHIHSGVKNALLNYIGDCHFQYLREYHGTDKVLYYIYAAKVSTGLLVEHRYIFIVSPTYYGDYVKPQTMNWTSFQSRTFTEELPITALVDITPNTDDKTELKEYTITLDDRNREYYTYNCNLAPIQVKMLRKSTSYGETPTTYPETGNLAAAFETYNCSITFL